MYRDNLPLLVNHIPERDAYGHFPGAKDGIGCERYPTLRL